jgi:hypothetical protein
VRTFLRFEARATSRVKVKGKFKVKVKSEVKVKVKSEVKVKVKSEVKGSGQECPLYTNNSGFLHFGRNDRVVDGDGGRASLDWTRGRCPHMSISQTSHLVISWALQNQENVVNRQKLREWGYLAADKGEICVANMSQALFAN